MPQLANKFLDARVLKQQKQPQNSFFAGDFDCNTVCISRGAVEGRTRRRRGRSFSTGCA